MTEVLIRRFFLCFGALRIYARVLLEDRLAKSASGIEILCFWADISPKGIDRLNLRGRLLLLLEGKVLKKWDFDGLLGF